MQKSPRKRQGKAAWLYQWENPKQDRKKTPVGATTKKPKECKAAVTAKHVYPHLFDLLLHFSSKQKDFTCSNNFNHSCQSVHAPT
jgi:hypothetical protein